MKTISSTLIRFTAVMAVLAFLVSASPAAALAQSVPGVNLTVAVGALNVRGGPGTNYPILGALHQGDQRTVSGRDAGGAWYQVPVLAGGVQLGWVFATYVQLSGDATALPIISVPAPVSTRATAGAAAPAGEGGTIVFQSSSGGSIYAINADGTNLRYLTDGIDPALSPDGHWVAFTRWDGKQTGITGSVWVININGTGERQVIGGIDQPKSPSWSSDGTQLVINLQKGGRVDPSQQCRTVIGKDQKEHTFCFTLPADPNWQIATLDVATGQYQDQYSDAKSFGPSWDPSNAALVVAQGQRGLTLTDLQQKSHSQLTNDPADRAPVFSPNGSKVADSFWQTGHWEIHAMNADGSGVVRLTQTPDTGLVDQMLAGNNNPKSWNNAAPAWSPDGSQIAFISDRTGSWQMWIMNADGSNQHPLFANGLPNGLTIRYDGVSERVISWR